MVVEPLEIGILGPLRALVGGAGSARDRRAGGPALSGIYLAEGARRGVRRATTVTSTAGSNPPCPARNSQSSTSSAGE